MRGGNALQLPTKSQREKARRKRQSGESNALKYALIAGGALVLIGGVLYFLAQPTKKKKKKKKKKKQAQPASFQAFSGQPTTVPVQPKEPTAEQKAAARATALKKKGNQAASRKDLGGAILLYSQAVEVNPRDAAIYSNRALMYLQLGKNEEALADAKTIQKLMPVPCALRAKSFHLAGVALKALGRREDAIVAFESAGTPAARAHLASLKHPAEPAGAAEPPTKPAPAPAREEGEAEGTLQVSTDESHSAAGEQDVQQAAEPAPGAAPEKSPSPAVWPPKAAPDQQGGSNLHARHPSLLEVRKQGVVSTKAPEYQKAIAEDSPLSPLAETSPTSPAGAEPKAEATPPAAENEVSG